MQTRHFMQAASFPKDFSEIRAVFPLLSQSMSRRDKKIETY